MLEIIKKNGLVFGIVLLAVVLLFWYVAYQRENKPRGIGPGGNIPPASAPTQSDLDIVLAPLGENATAEQRNQRFRIAQSLAQEAEYVDITGCTPSPAVFKTKVGETIRFKNQDSVGHELVFGREDSHQVPPLTVSDIAVDFSKGRGTYIYSCDQSRQVGAMLVVE